MTLHLQECLDLTDCQILSISERDKFIKGTEELIGILQYVPFIQGFACARDDLCKKV